MVDIIQERPKKPSFGQQLLSGLGQSLPGVMEKLLSEYDVARENEALGLPRDLRNTKLREALLESKTRPEKAPIGGLSGQSTPPEVSGAIQEVLNKFPDATSDQLALAFDTARVPRAYSNSYIENRRRQDESKEKSRVEEEKTTRKEELTFHQDTAKFDEKIREDAERASKQLEATKDIISAIKSGKVKPTTISSLFRRMGTVGDKIANAFLNAEQGKIEASIPLLIEGWREVFGTRISDADLKIIESKLPDIGKTPEANKAIVDIIDKYAKRSVLKGEVAKEIRKQNKGKRPLNYIDQVEEEFQKRLGETQENQVQEEIMSELPNPSQYSGKKIVDEDSGVIYQSNGTQWIRIK